ncbi:MAG: deoxyguanosinetriphosphate triphosphohydrolase [Leptospiraceae bacterium]|nr:deoxyguanosinetriphosphate triphosphohydrolase [Leptospiraceae bacterium]
MIKRIEELLKEEDSKLFSYAVKNSEHTEREYPETLHPFRLPLQRDRDRLFHSQAFKRLEYKTQVFINSEGDHFRTRLTHTLEVAGVSRTVATALGLNSLLAEVIALCHDIGHSPFGHAGQDKLSELMEEKGGFEHNKQSLRVLRELENRYIEHPGLNLCLITLMGIMKHGGDYRPSQIGELRKAYGASLEARVADVSDEITYNCHDIEDGLEKGYISVKDLSVVSIWQEYYENSIFLYRNADAKLLRRHVIRRLMNEMILDLFQHTASEIERLNLKHFSELSEGKFRNERIIAYSEDMYKKTRELKKFLHENLYHHPKVEENSNRGKEIIEKLFQYFLKNLQKVPESYLNRIQEDGEYRVVCDYIAGLTDRYAEQKYKEIYC